MRRFLIAGNWKMNGGLAANELLLSGLKEGIGNAGRALAGDVVVCVPAPYLSQCRTALAGTDIALGAQNVSEHASGAHTGEIATSMLHDFGCRYVIVGHSERRAYHAETDDAIGRKTRAVLAAGLVPIVCVGETLAEREAGQTETVVCRQLDAVLAAISASDLDRVVVAYEPVWAIGTGKTATPQMAQDVHAHPLRRQHEARECRRAARHAGHRRRPDRRRRIESVRFPGDRARRALNCLPASLYRILGLNTLSHRN
jgi:triosephosphate isomerase